MDIYDSKLAKLFGKLNGNQRLFAVTTSADCTRYSCGIEEVHTKWRLHEEQHKIQIRRLGWFGFFAPYVWKLLTGGYKNMSFEVEARNAEAQL